MSYDVYSYATRPGDDPDEAMEAAMDAADELRDGEEPEGASPEQLDSLLAELQRAFPTAVVPERSELEAVVADPEGAFAIEVTPMLCECTISYGAGLSEEDAFAVVDRFAAAARAAGHNEVFDPQTGESVPTDGAAGGEASDRWRESMATVEALRRGEGPAPEAAPGLGGRLRRLFGRS